MIVSSFQRLEFPVHLKFDEYLYNHVVSRLLWKLVLSETVVVWAYYTFNVISFKRDQTKGIIIIMNDYHHWRFRLASLLYDKDCVKTTW